MHGDRHLDLTSPTSQARVITETTPAYRQLGIGDANSARCSVASGLACLHGGRAAAAAITSP